MGSLKKFGLGIISNICLTVYKGFVLLKLWQWFIVPLGIFEIDLIKSIGVIIIFGFLKGLSISEIEDNKEVSIVKIALYSIVVNSTFLFSGFVYSLFM